MELKTPTKPSKTSKKSSDPFLVDDKEQSLSPKSVTDEEDFAELRKRFVGDVELPEGAFHITTSIFGFNLRAMCHRPGASPDGFQASLCPFPYSIS